MFSNGADGLGFSTGGVKRMDLGSGGDLTLHAVSTETQQINVGNGRSSDGQSQIDFVADPTYATYGLRVVRNAGENGSTQIAHRGTGNLQLLAQDAGAIVLSTSNTTRMTIGSGGAATFNGNIISNARMVNAAGSAGTPAYSFDGDGDTGMYRWGVNAIGFSAGGSERFRITPTQVEVTGDLVLNGTDVQTQLDSAIGVGQQWYDDGSIVSGTAYTNSYGRPIQVQLSFNGNGSKTLGLSHDGTTWVESLNMNNDGDDSDVNTSFIVPAGHSWRVVGGWTLSRRLTLR